MFVNNAIRIVLSTIRCKKKKEKRTFDTVYRQNLNNKKKKKNVVISIKLQKKDNYFVFEICRYNVHSI